LAKELSAQADWGLSAQ